MTREQFVRSLNQPLTVLLSDITQPHTWRDRYIIGRVDGLIAAASYDHDLLGFAYSLQSAIADLHFARNAQID